ncbi:hypothetical protein [Halorubrum yunnanense]|uniref:Uncharacterized protein n=1 Tax=Halorubrum yunnanense TaxID=1526162 RepID=A0ABD5YP24_9EURY|nr:hypothetical protein [Halorubrum yunnanense]
MEINKTNSESGPAQLKDNPRPEDLKTATSPAARLLAWLRA